MKQNTIKYKIIPFLKQKKNLEEHDEKEKIKGKIKRSKGSFEDVDMSNELCDGGG